MLVSESETRAYDSDSYANLYAPEKSIFQDDSRVFHRGGFFYDYVTQIESFSVCESGALFAAILKSGEKASLKITVSDKKTVRLKLWQKELEPVETSAMLVPQHEPVSINSKITETDKSYSMDLCGIVITIDKNPFTIVINNESGRKLMELETENVAGMYIVPPLGFRKKADISEPFISWKVRNDERFFGLGEKWNKVEKTSTRATIWAADTCGSNTTDMCYKSIPVLFSTYGWGIMVHSSFRTKWEIATFSYSSGAVLSEDPSLDIFLFLGSSLKDLLFSYTSLTGRPSMPPKWALGVWMSRCAYVTRTQVEEVLDTLRAKRFPCDVIHLDPLWMKTHYYFKINVDACDFVHNEENFPDRKGMLKQFHDKGFDTCFWINPYIPQGQPIYDEATERGFIVKDLDGKPAKLEFGQEAGMVDFTNPEAVAWWKGKLAELFKDGASVVKTDYGDRVPENALFHNGKTGKEMHNMYLHLMGEIAFETVKEVNGKGIVWRRSGYIGSQRYPGTWAGDTQVSWEGLRCCMRGGLSAGITGEAFWTHDIGGFCGPQPSPELFCRWAQFGMLSPLTRFHGTSPREPWAYGEEVFSIVKKYAQLRYRLMPYLLAMSNETCTTGVPLMRHMALEFPGEPNIDSIDDQYMLGSDILVAPIIIEGAQKRDVYLPGGMWYDFYEPTVRYEGRRFISVEAPLETIPLFIREGAVVPRYCKDIQHLKEPVPEKIEITIYPGDSNRILMIDEETRCTEIEYKCSNGISAMNVKKSNVSIEVLFKNQTDGSMEINGVITKGKKVTDGYHYTID